MADRVRRLGHGDGHTVKTWAILTVASALSSLAVLPYVLELQGVDFATINERRAASGKRTVPVPLIPLLGLLQSGVTFGIISGLGLRGARTLGLEVGLFPRTPAGELAEDAAMGAGAALAAAALDFTVFKAARHDLQRAGVREPAVWKGLLATTYGAIGEEVQMRLGLQTLLAAGIRRLRHESTVPPGPATMWPAILISNLAFGAGHLPITVRLTHRLTPGLVARAIVLNALVGVPAGYLYWKRSLLDSMAAHGGADLALHVGGALLQRRG